MFPRLTVIGTNGFVDVNPSAPSYSYGAVVTLTATPNSGYDFVGWALGASGTANPLVLTLTSNSTVLARFRVPGDDFDQRILLMGQNATQSGLSNTNATKQTGEPNHAGNSGGRSLWWTWTAPLAGPVTITTAGTTMRNMVAVYTGNVVNGLTVVTNHLAGAGTITATVHCPDDRAIAYHEPLHRHATKKDAPPWKIPRSGPFPRRFSRIRRMSDSTSTRRSSRS